MSNNFKRKNDVCHFHSFVIGKPFFFFLEKVESLSWSLSWLIKLNFLVFNKFGEWETKIPANNPIFLFGLSLIRYSTKFSYKLC